jgi:type VI secretion system protein ImpE
MDALSLYRAGRLREAIDALGDELKKQPLDTKRRTFLFELLCFAGEYDRATKHLDILSDSSPEAAAGAMLYRSALHAERERQDMFARNALPIGSSHPSSPGELNGEAFTGLTDADPRIGENLEVFIAGSYTWSRSRPSRPSGCAICSGCRPICMPPKISGSRTSVRFCCR